ncbi:MAG: acyl-CoA dehydrogenase family protein [Ilumatobacteraceae bacterium]
MSISTDVAVWVADNWRLDITLREWWQRLSAAGLAFPMWPEGLGGRGWTKAQAREVLEVLGAAGVIGPPTGIAVNMGVATVLRHGTPDQQRRFVPPVANGTRAWCQLFSEPGVGSDLAAVATRAERDGDEFVVSGQKLWNSGADVSDFGMLLARTDVEVPKHAGISWMMIDMRQAGVETRPLVQMNGGAEFCEVFLTEARVPIENVVGRIGEGWDVARTTLLHERGSIGDRVPKGLRQARPGSLGGHLDRLVGDVVETAQRSERDASRRFDIMVGASTMIRLAHDFGRSDDPAIRQRVADYWIRSQVHRLTGLRSRDNARGGKPGPEGSVSKLSTAMLAHMSRDTSLAILGAEGMLVGESARDGGRVQRAGLSAHAPSLGGGTNEIQRNILGERVLGLPREPVLDTAMPFRDLPRQ